MCVCASAASLARKAWASADMSKGWSAIIEKFGGTPRRKRLEGCETICYTLAWDLELQNATFAKAFDHKSQKDWAVCSRAETNRQHEISTVGVEVVWQLAGCET